MTAVNTHGAVDTGAEAPIGIALAYPDATVDGFDVDASSVEAARENARESGWTTG
jgi:methylase of polypeptide subunit release factors